MPNYQIDEVSLLNTQLVTTAIFIISLFVSLSITYNDREQKLHKKGIYTEKQSKKITNINRTVILILTLSYLYINIENKNFIKPNQKDYSNLQIGASILSTIAAIIVLYVVLKSNSDIVDTENPAI